MGGLGFRFRETSLEVGVILEWRGGTSVGGRPVGPGGSPEESGDDTNDAISFTSFISS